MKKFITLDNDNKHVKFSGMNCTYYRIIQPILLEDISTKSMG